MAVADVDQGPRIGQLRVHEELLDRLGVVDRRVAADALDLCVYRVDGVPPRALSLPRRDDITEAVRNSSKSEKRPPTSSEDGDDARRWRKVQERSPDAATRLLELLALGRRLDVLEVDQGVLAEVHDLSQIVEQALVALEALEELDERFRADLLVVPAEIENKTTPGIVR